MVEALYQPFPMLGSCRGQVWRYAPQYRRPRHFHDEPELNLVVAGNGKFGAGNAVLEVAARELFCWPPGCDHELLEASADFDLYVIGLTPELSARALGLDSARLSRLMALCVVPLAELEPSVVEAHVA